MITRLFPLSTNVSGSDWTAFGASPAHVGLSDASDATGVRRQMSVTEAFRTVEGTAMTQLPSGSGYVKQLTIGFRGAVDIAFSSSAQVTLGGGLLTLGIPDLATTPTTYTVVKPPLSFAQINSLTWHVVASWIAHNGVFVDGYELWLDVEWFPVTAVQISQIY